MKKKTMVIICCLISSCYAQPRQTKRIVYNPNGQKNVDLDQSVEVDPARDEEKNSCSVVQEALLEDDFFYDIEDEQDFLTENNEKPACILSRLQDLVNSLGVQAVLGALYLADVCSDASEYIQRLLYEKK